MTNLEERTVKYYKLLHRKGPFGLFLQKLEASKNPEILKIVKEYQNETFVNEVFFRKVAGRAEKGTITHPSLVKFQADRNCRFPDDVIYKKISEQDEKCKNIEDNPNPHDWDGSELANGKNNASELDKILANNNEKDKVLDNNNSNTSELANDKSLLEDPTICQRNTLLNYYLFKKLDKEQKVKYSKIFSKRYNVPLTNNFCKQYLKVEKAEKFRKTSFLLWLNSYLKNDVSTEILRLPSLEIALKASAVWDALPNDQKKKWYKLANQDCYRRKF